MKTLALLLAIALVASACGAGPDSTGVAQTETRIESASSELSGEVSLWGAPRDGDFRAAGQASLEASVVRCALAELGWFVEPEWAGSWPTNENYVWSEVAIGELVEAGGTTVRSFGDTAIGSLEAAVMQSSPVKLTLDLADATVISGPRIAHPIVLSPGLLEPLAQDVEAGATLLVGTSTEYLGAAAVFSLRPDGTATSLDCDHRYPFVNDAELHAQLGVTSGADLMRTLLGGDSKSVGALYAEVVERLSSAAAPLSWSEIDPMRRSLDHASPAEVLAKLEAVTVELALPSEWFSESRQDFAVCIRQSSGWGPCVPTTAQISTEDEKQPTEVLVPLPFFATRSEALEIWFLDVDGRFESAVGPVASLSLESLARDDVAWRVVAKDPDADRNSPLVLGSLPVETVFSVTGAADAE